MKILFVDDESDITSTTKRGLENLGHKVDAFIRPSEALTHDPIGYNIAILDVRMPEMSGFELARKLWRKNEKLQVCFLSAFEINAREAMTTLPSLKSHCFLRKPLAPSELARHIEKHMIDVTSAAERTEVKRT